MSISQEVLIAILALVGSALVGLFAYLSATRNATKQVRLERDRLASEEEAKRDSLLAAVHKEAADSGRELYQQLCAEQQKRIEQQHKDLEGLSEDVTSLRNQLGDTQTELMATRKELVVTQDELRKTREELQETRDLLASTKEELRKSRDAQKSLHIETESLRARVVELEAELSAPVRSRGARRRGAAPARRGQASAPRAIRRASWASSGARTEGKQRIQAQALGRQARAPARSQYRPGSPRRRDADASRRKP